MKKYLIFVGSLSLLGLLLSDWLAHLFGYAEANAWAKFLSAGGCVIIGFVVGEIRQGRKRKPPKNSKVPRV